MPPKEIELSPQEKLGALRALDQFRTWGSLEDQRRCLACGQTITGAQIRVVGPAPFRLQCPTPGCPAIPMDWSLSIPVRDGEGAGSNGHLRVTWEKSHAHG